MPARTQGRWVKVHGNLASHTLPCKGSSKARHWIGATAWHGGEPRQVVAGRGNSFFPSHQSSFHCVPGTRKRRPKGRVRLSFTPRPCTTPSSGTPSSISARTGSERRPPAYKEGVCRLRPDCTFRAKAGQRSPAHPQPMRSDGIRRPELQGKLRKLGALRLGEKPRTRCRLSPSRGRSFPLMPRSDSTLPYRNAPRPPWILNARPESAKGGISRGHLATLPLAAPSHTPASTAFHVKHPRRQPNFPSRPQGRPARFTWNAMLATPPTFPAKFYRRVPRETPWQKPRQGVQWRPSPFHFVSPVLRQWRSAWPAAASVRLVWVEVSAR